LTVEEAEMILYGVPFIDLEEWKEHTEYGPGISADHKVKMHSQARPLNGSGKFSMNSIRSNLASSFNSAQVLSAFPSVGSGTIDHLMK
jgi:hypothetical protein